METLRPGDPLEIGGYRLLARLGSGGMGEVFLARTPSGRALALKTVHRELSLEADFAQRFDREIRTSDRIRSPWTVSVVDFSAPGAAPQWLATEYVPAPSLGDWVRSSGPLHEPAVWQLGRELSAALVSVRAAGVVHRDIKPANILLGPERPFLIDFGIARIVRDPRHTRTGTVIGTPGFLAPEQATGTPAGAPADVFSLAAVLTYAATGRSPFLADGEEVDLPALLYRIVHDQPHLDGVPPALLPLLQECLAKDPHHRPTADEIAARLGNRHQKEDWNHTVPHTLIAETQRRHDELRHLLTPPPANTPIPNLPPPPVEMAVGPGARTGAGAGRPGSSTETPPSPATPRTSGGRAVLQSRPAGAAAGAAVLAVAVALAVWLPGRDHDGAAPPSSPRPSASTPPTATAGTLPPAWTGTWSGTGPGTPEADGITRARTGEFTVTVTLNGAAVGELVGRQVSNLKEMATGRNLGCTEALQLRQVRADSAVFEAVTSHPTDRTAVLDCPRGNLYVLTMTEPDRLTLESEGAQSAGAPTTLTRRP
ncbi:serine/threonine-protein kinase [Streptomyces sp. NPDC048257]|uniref:serine/threonine-protein kinase n=1 Tax=Streptomyces sp. NPDC048257 TaxID=3365526 RepID=UPI003715D6C2